MLACGGQSLKAEPGHDRIQAAADSQKCNVFSRVDVTALQSDCCRNRKCGSPGVAEKVDCRKVEFLIESQVLIKKLAMGSPYLMSKRLVDGLVRPSKCLLCLLPRFCGQPDSCVQQSLRVGLHSRAVVAEFLGFDATCTKFVMGRVCSAACPKKKITGLGSFCDRKERLPPMPIRSLETQTLPSRPFV